MTKLTRLALVSLAALPFASHAGSTSCAASPCATTFDVSASVIAACTSLSATDLAFGGAIAPASTTTQSQTSTISANCSNGTVYTIELNYGLFATGTPATQRRVEDGAGHFLDYTIFQPTAAGAGATSTAWGTAAQNATYSNTGTGSAQNLTATGQLKRISGSPVGDYSDTVTVKMTY